MLRQVVKGEDGGHVVSLPPVGTHTSAGQPRAPRCPRPSPAPGEWVCEEALWATLTTPHPSPLPFPAPAWLEASWDTASDLL